jgi:predicted nucleotidyltransferase
VEAEVTSVIAELEAHRDELVELCRRFGVRPLDVFGSAAVGEFDPARSDVDFLVELEPPAGTSRFEAFFGLKEALADLLGRPVDLVDPSALDNPYFAASVERSRRALYAA